MIGDRVRITARGTFSGFIGTIRKIQRRVPRSRAFYWIEIPDHPWSSRDNPLWSFEWREIEQID